MLMHPNEFFQALLQKPGGRSERRVALTKLHEICLKHHESGSLDFSLPVIGRQCEAAGFIKSRALYNAPSADYRALIEAWALYSMSSQAPGSLKNNTKSNQLNEPKPRHRIARNYVEVFSGAKIVSKNEGIVSSLELKIKMLESQVKILEGKLEGEDLIKESTVSRPRGRPSSAESDWELKSKDVETLKKAIHPRFIKNQGWSVSSRGEILNSAGEILYESSYIQAIKKLLANRN